jgi:DNA-binding Xre family transcriptional regulator
MNHRQKQKLARKNMTKRELYEKVGIFETKFWEDRKQKIREKVKKTELNRVSKD